MPLVHVVTVAVIPTHVVEVGKRRVSVIDPSDAAEDAIPAARRDEDVPTELGRGS